MKKILFVSDYVCPYCLVAKKALETALLKTGVKAEITYHPYELTEEPAERVDTYHDENRKSHYQILIDPCKELKLDMKLPPNVVPRPYTRLAFEGLFYARDHGCEAAYNALIYQAYFIDEQDIGDIQILTDLAASVGMNAADFRSALLEGRYSAHEKEAVKYAKQELKVRQVPTIYIDGKQLQLNTYSVEEFCDFLN